MTPNSTEEWIALKACPFCGGEARGQLYVRDGGKVQCANHDCLASTTQFNPDGAGKAITAWNTRTDNDVSGLVEAGQAIIARMFSTYTARNGRRVGIEAGDGEKCWIVHSDEITALEAALAKHRQSNGGKA